MKKAVFVLALFLLLSVCAGCGAERIKVDVSDGGNLTILEPDSSMDAKEYTTETAPTEESMNDEPIEDLKGGDYSGRVDEKGKDSDGMEIPKFGEGETLYIGFGELPDVGMVKIAMVLSEDKQSVHGITVFLKDFGGTVGGVEVPFSTMQNSTDAEYALPVQEESYTDSVLKDVHIEGGRIYARIDYVFKNIDVFHNKGGDQLIPLGEVEFWLKRAE